MSAEEELVLGAALWAIGISVLVGVALATPRFETEGYWLGGLAAFLGLCLIWWACDDLFTDEVVEDVKDRRANGSINLTEVYAEKNTDSPEYVGLAFLMALEADMEITSRQVAMLAWTTAATFDTLEDRKRK